MNETTPREKMALLAFGFDGDNGNTDFYRKMPALSKRGYVFI